MHNGEKKLWREVIKLAIADALNKRFPITRNEAWNWIFGNDPDFEFICDLAEVTPGNVRREFLKKRIHRQKH
jgi:hypothetical protein